MLFDVKNVINGQPNMTELGRQTIPSLQIQASTLYKRTLDSFIAEFEDEKIA